MRLDARNAVCLLTRVQVAEELGAFAYTNLHYRQVLLRLYALCAPLERRWCNYIANKVRHVC